MPKNLNGASFQQELLTKYQTIKNNFLGGLLIDLTQNNIKIALLARIDNITPEDQLVLDNFYNSNSENEKTINKHDIEAYKPIINFLNKKSDKMRNRETVNLLAFLLDYQPRPLTKYLNSHDSVSAVKEVSTEFEGNKIEENIKRAKLEIKQKISTHKKINFAKILSILGIIAISLFIISEFTSLFKQELPNEPNTIINIENLNADKTYYYYYIADGKIDITDDINAIGNNGTNPKPITHQVLNTYFYQQGVDTTAANYKIVRANYFNKGNTLPITDAKQFSNTTPEVENKHTNIPEKENFKTNTNNTLSFAIIHNEKIDANLLPILQEKYKDSYQLIFNTKKEANYNCTGKTVYTYRKSKMTPDRIICDLEVVYQLKNIKTNQIIESKRELVIGTGFSEQKAKENALFKLSQLLN